MTAPSSPQLAVPSVAPPLETTALTAADAPVAQPATASPAPTTTAQPAAASSSTQATTTASSAQPAADVPDAQPATVSPAQPTTTSPTQPATASPFTQAASPAPPAASDATSSTANRDPWALAYDIFRTREPKLVEDYKKHLASLQVGEVDNSRTDEADLSKTRSVEAIVKRLSDQREQNQWRVSLLGADIKIREQAERLVKFLLWADPVVKNAISTQPYAALAWTGVSLLLPVGILDPCSCPFSH